MAFMCTFSGCVSETVQNDVPAQTEMELSQGLRERWINDRTGRERIRGTVTI